MISNITVYDISVDLGRRLINYPGDIPFSRKLIYSIRDNEICDLSQLEMSAHSGTHIDTPAHFIKGGKSIDNYAAENQKYK